MLLGRLEFALMNNPFRTALQRCVEGPVLRRMGGLVPGGKALEIGYGRGVGVALILDRFHAKSVDAFDLDPRMVALARRRLRRRAPQVRLWIGDAAAIPAPDAAYDAVFEFGVLHHVPNWQAALSEVNRVLKPGGRFYAEEPLGRLLNHPLVHRLCAHPIAARFEAADFRQALHAAGLLLVREQSLWRTLFWFFARKGKGVKP
jgi:ubiquinone/menaquinone biosynthesis C-methylase UbiE